MSADIARHAGYIIASYAAAAVILAVLIGQSVVAYRRARLRLGEAGEDNA